MRKILCASLAAAAVALLPAPAQAASGVVDITVTTGGFTAPESVPAGALTLRVRSDDPAGAWLGLVRLRPGVALDTYLGHLRQAMSDDPAKALAGGRAVVSDVDIFGGAAVAHVPAEVTMVVPSGDYHLVDFRDAGEPDFASRVRPLRVGPAGASELPVPSAVVVAGRSGYLAPSTIKSGSPVLVVNLSEQHNEAMLMPVRPGTTLAQLDAFFAGAGSAPFTGGPTGVVPMSPWRAAVLTAALPPGDYALVTWVRDLRTGEMLAARGMRALMSVV